MGFYLSQGPTIAVNQDLYVDAIVPITTTTVRVVDSTGKQLTPADGLSSIRLEVGGQMDLQSVNTVNGQVTTSKTQKTFPSGKVSIFPGLQDFSSTWQTASTPNVLGVVDLRRPSMTAGVQGTVTMNFENSSKYLLSETREVSISPNGGTITVTASFF